MVAISEKYNLYDKITSEIEKVNYWYEPINNSIKLNVISNVSIIKNVKMINKGCYEISYL